MICKCVACGQEFDDTNRNFKIYTNTIVPFRVAPLRQPLLLCEQCEEEWRKKVEEDIQTEISSRGTET